MGFQETKELMNRREAERQAQLNKLRKGTRQIFALAREGEHQLVQAQQSTDIHTKKYHGIQRQAALQRAELIHDGTL